MIMHHQLEYWLTTWIPWVGYGCDRTAVNNGPHPLDSAVAVVAASVSTDRACPAACGAMLRNWIFLPTLDGMKDASDSSSSSRPVCAALAGGELKVLKRNRLGSGSDPILVLTDLADDESLEYTNACLLPLISRASLALRVAVRGSPSRCGNSMSALTLEFDAMGVCPASGAPANDSDREGFAASPRRCTEDPDNSIDVSEN